MVVPATVPATDSDADADHDKYEGSGKQEAQGKAGTVSGKKVQVPEGGGGKHEEGEAGQEVPVAKKPSKLTEERLCQLATARKRALEVRKERSDIRRKEK